MASTTQAGGKTSWIVVADEYRVDFYERTGRRGPLKAIATLENVPARLKSGDLVSDREGRSFDSHGQGRHSMSREKSSPKTNAAAHFAKEIVARISKAKHTRAIDDFSLIAAPRFLGVLRNALDVAGNLEPDLTVDKDFVGKDEAAIELLLEKH